VGIGITFCITAFRSSVCQFRAAPRESVVTSPMFFFGISELWMRKERNGTGYLRDRGWGNLVVNALRCGGGSVYVWVLVFVRSCFVYCCCYCCFCVCVCDDGG